MVFLKGNLSRSPIRSTRCKGVATNC
jgi:hypothetical protein